MLVSTVFLICFYLSLLCWFLPVHHSLFNLSLLYWFLPLLPKLFLSVLPMLIFTITSKVGFCPSYVDFRLSFQNFSGALPMLIFTYPSKNFLHVLPMFIFYLSFLRSFYVSFQYWFLPVLLKLFLSVPSMLIFNSTFFILQKLFFTCPSHVHFYLSFLSCYYLSLYFHF